MFVGVCVFEGVAIKTRSLIFKSINIHKEQKAMELAHPKDNELKKITYTKPIQEVTPFYWTNYEEI